MSKKKLSEDQECVLINAITTIHKIVFPENPPRKLKTSQILFNMGALMGAKKISLTVEEMDTLLLATPKQWEQAKHHYYVIIGGNNGPVD